MCDLSTTSIQKKIRGYKVVARKPKGKRYFSIAMGFKYPLDGHIPAVRKQYRICKGYVGDILSVDSRAHRKDMIGRTAIFLELAAAREECQYLAAKWNAEYRLVVVLSEISGDLMVGHYTSCKVAAGRHIHFIEEVINNTIPRKE